ncbi:MAG: hypothetical protein RLY16_1715 [Bacteroidota bacterium]
MINEQRFFRWLVEPTNDAYLCRFDSLTGIRCYYLPQGDTIKENVEMLNSLGVEKQLCDSHPISGLDDFRRLLLFVLKNQDG